MINNNRSFFYLHENTPSAIGTRMKRLTGVSKGAFPFMYLGCLGFYGRKRKSHFETLLKYVIKSIMSCRINFLSFGGRYIFISYVLQSITYVPPISKGPSKKVIEQLHQIVIEQLHQNFANFFQSKIGGVKEKHLVAWDEMYYPKKRRWVGIQIFT